MHGKRVILVLLCRPSHTLTSDIFSARIYVSAQPVRPEISQLHPRPRRSFPSRFLKRYKTIVELLATSLRHLIRGIEFAVKEIRIDEKTLPNDTARCGTKHDVLQIAGASLGTPSCMGECRLGNAGVRYTSLSDILRAVPLLSHRWRIADTPGANCVCSSTLAPSAAETDAKTG